MSEHRISARGRNLNLRAFHDKEKGILCYSPHLAIINYLVDSHRVWEMQCFGLSGGFQSRYKSGFIGAMGIIKCLEVK